MSFSYLFSISRLQVQHDQSNVKLFGIKITVPEKVNLKKIKGMSKWLTGYMYFWFSGGWHNCFENNQEITLRQTW